MNRWVALSALLALAGASGAWVVWPREVIVLIVLDTVRADSAHGTWIDGLRARSTVYRRAISTSSWTAPSTASIFTGLYPTEHGVTGGFRAQQRAAGVDEIVLEGPTIDLRGMPAEVATLPERLHAAGWRTLGAASNVNIGTELGFDRGFDRFRKDRDADADALVGTVWWWLLISGPTKPVFVYLHLNDAHHPYRPRRPWFQRPADVSLLDRARYVSEIAAMDAALADLFATLERWGEPRVVLVSDHGEGFGEHGVLGHVFTLHGEVNDVAMIVHEPGRPPETVDTPVSLIDVAPTVLDLAGIPTPGSLLAPPDPARVLFAHRASPTKETTWWSAVKGPYKLLLEEGSGRPPTLYRRDIDPGERVDRSAEYPEVVAHLSAALADFRARTGHEGPAVEVELDPGLVEHLTELGYVE